MGIESGGTFDLRWLAENTKQAVCCRSALTGNKVDNFKVTISAFCYAPPPISYETSEV